MSRWLRSAMTSLELELLRKYIETEPEDIPAGDKAILLSDPLACAEYANYYEQKNHSLLPEEWYNFLKTDKDASELYTRREGLLNLYWLPENKMTELERNEDVTKHD